MTSRIYKKKKRWTLKFTSKVLSNVELMQYPYLYGIFSLLVPCLCSETSVYELKCRFEGFGSISRAKIADKSGHGFVTFRAKESAEAAIRAALDPHGIIIRNKRVLVSWVNDSLPPWKMGNEVSKLSKDVLSKKVPYKIPHGREGRSGNREAVLAAATAAAGLRRGITIADTVRHVREVVSYDDL